ncbi:MAG: hypothetical protein KGJ96_13055 [Xanthomonadaceae bacterium]|nr:hypothetical protein [Xanthomonadaceae bacterium]MDE2249493.1 hypothetical protein [Xanthomonadaceae bacterium]
MIAYTLRQDDDGQWNIRCKGLILANGLSLESAIEQARGLARTERRDSCRPTCIEVITTDTSPLACLSHASS